jgi:two-component sensor histidine kinase
LDIYVSSGLSTDATLAAIDRATRRGVALIGLGILTAFGGAYLAGRLFIRRPVTALLAAAERWRAGDYTRRSGIAGQGDEFGALAAAFDATVAEVAAREQELTRIAESLRDTERRQRLLLLELSHRVKNTLATVQTIALRSLTRDRTLDDAREVLVQRLLALSTTHDLLTATAWRGVDLRALVGAELRPYGGRIAWTGPDLLLAPQPTQTVGLILHELATNAAKHGALAHPDGRVTVSWSFDRGAPATVRLVWKERGGPPACPPESKGFGLTLLERAVEHELRGSSRLDFQHEGLIYELVVPLAELEPPPPRERGEGIPTTLPP